MRASILMFGAALGLALAVPSVAQPSQRAVRPIPVLTNGAAIDGELTPLDAQRRSGKYEDVFTIEGRQGQRIDLRLQADDFDPYLLVTGPGGFQLGNDDDPAGDTLHSRLTFELPADGTYRVSATSYSPGAMGAYRILMGPAAEGAELARMTEARPIQLGASISGDLRRGDAQVNERFVDRYRFQATRGQRVRISLSSNEFDTLLRLEGPDGVGLVNDDIGADDNGRLNTNSRLETVLAEDGTYTLTVSSYGANATGKYNLSFAEGAGNPRHAALETGRVLVVAVGVSDYERISTLPNTDDDATELLATLRQTGMLHPASVALTNGDATTANVQAALRRAAAQAGPNDLFLFFYSGHGDQVDVERSREELDGRAETIELFDEAMRDAELQPLIDAIDARMVLVALDSCYSGGFRNLVNRPNVMGLFSSEEDLTSLVASRLEAGGYLSYYLRSALAGEADRDGDRIVTAGELSSYLRRSFRMEGDIPAETREDEANYQYLLVERGGVHVDDGVVRLRNVQQASAPTNARANR